MSKTSCREYMQVIEDVCGGRGERAALQPWSSRCKERRRVPGKESVPGHAASASAARAIERRNGSKSWMLWTREWQCSGCAYSFAVECGYGSSSCPWVLVETNRWRDDTTITLFA